MNNLTYLQRLLSQWTDPKMLATAYRDYFQRVYQRILDRSAYLSGEDITEPASQLGFYNDGTQYVAYKLSDLKPLITRFMDGEDNLTLSGIRVEDIMQQISSDADNTYLTLISFDSLLKDNVNPGQFFSDTISFRLDSLDVGVRDSISDLYGRITSSGTLGDRVRAVMDFTSSSTFQEVSPDEVVAADTPLANYTGQNPMVGWLGGIDIDWTNVVDVHGAIVKAQVKFMTTVTKTLFKLVAAPFKWLAGKISKTFVNPVDFECTGDKCHFFDESITTRIDIASLPNPGSSYIAGELGDDGVTMQMAGSIYKVNAVPGNQDQIVINRITKPLSYKAIYNCLQSFESKLGAWNGNDVEAYFTGSATWSDAASIVNELSRADLDLDAKENENVVYAGLYLSRYMDQAYSWAFYYAYLYLTNQLTGFNPSAEVNLNQAITQETNGLQDILSTFIQHIANIYFYCKSAVVTGQVTPLKLLSQEISPLPVDVGSLTVTNQDFMRIITFFGQKQQGNAIVDIDFQSTTRPYLNGFAVEVPSFNYLLKDFSLQKWPIYALALKVLGNSDEQFDGVWYGYHRGTDYAYDVNCSVKSDVDNAQAVGKFLSTTVVVAAIATAAVFGGKAVLSFKRSVTAARAATPALYSAMNAAVQSGDKQAANAAYQAIKRNNRIIRVGNTIFGGAAASSYSLKNLSDESSTIIGLIRG